ncbi:MAG: histidine kinase dimerization/phosphoacceptor domain -containing protein, partial [Deltaproteobacteria bacterium]
GESGWSIVIERSLKDIYQDDITRIIEILAVSLLLYLLITFYLVYLRKISLFRKTEELLKAETKLRKSEESERETREYLEKLVDHANAPIIVWDPQFRITRFNHAFENLTGLKAEEVLGKEIDLLFPEERREECLTHVRQTTGGDRWEVIEIPILQTGGTVRTVLWNSATLYSPDGNTVIATIAQGQDVTARKKADEKIKASLREKETLLKEIHHRVKNNLQIISSLLRLQSGYISDEKMEGIFRECQDRITAMAAVHSLLYKSQNFAEINFGEYVRETATELFRSYKTGAVPISLVIHAENVMLPIDTAIPCGLIINELLTNALKYAFPGIRAGEIIVEMSRTENQIILLFADNGIGFPQHLDFRNSETLGLKLVQMLVKQLEGSIELDSKTDEKDGTRYVIRLKPTILPGV